MMCSLSLYMTLSSLNVICTEHIAARTEKIAKVKNKKKVKAIDEMLVKFEKAWRKKTHKKAKNTKQ